MLELSYSHALNSLEICIYQPKQLILHTVNNIILPHRTTTHVLMNLPQLMYLLYYSSQPK